MRLAIAEGTTFSDTALQEAQRRVFGLGVFATIRVTAGEPDEATARIPVRSVSCTALWTAFRFPLCT